MGAVGLDTVRREFGGRLRLEWKSYLLRPHPEPKSLEAFRRYTRSWKRPASAPQAPVFNPWAGDEGPPSHSLPAQVALKAAACQGLFEPFHLALMKAYFSDSRDISARETLVDIARNCGLDSAAFAVALDDEELARGVVDEHNQALQAGVSAVPTVVVDGVLPLPGAQDAAVYRRVIEKRLELQSRGS